MERDEAWIRQMWETYRRLMRKHRKVNDPLRYEDLLPETLATFKGLVRAARRKQ